MRICELKQKEVINIHTCRSLGCPLDVEFCCETARLKALIMPEPGKFCWCFSKENEYSIPWDCIRQIGDRKSTRLNSSHPSSSRMPSSA